MLRSIVLKNFVHFKDKTVLALHTSSEGPKEESSPSTSKQSKKACADVQDKITDTSNCNDLNIFVGANFCGKSTVLELIRRCMTKEINVTETTLFDRKSIAYAFCKFHLHPYGEILSGIIKKPGVEELYKVLMYIDKTEWCLKFSDSSKTTYKCHLQEPDQKVIQLMFEKHEDIDDILHNLIDKIELERREENIASLIGEPNWKSIEDKYIATFPLRGIGSVQWTRSKKIGEAHKDTNYRMACKRAEVISTLLSERHKSDIDEEREQKIFKFVTYPEEFEFETKDGNVVVKHEKSASSLLKTSEGILEAKLTSLLLAHKGIQTLCLEEPDRGMHPQMIERLKKVLYRNALNKTIIVVTHSPYFIDTCTINKTHVFFRKKADKSYVCSVRNAGHSKDLSNVTHIETLRILLFATKVLLVEGETDREVVQGILTQHTIDKDESSDDDFTNISSHQIITIGGCDNAGKVKKFCNFINLPCLCLLDRDKPLKVKDGKITEFWGIEDKDLQKYLNDKYVRKELQLFLNCNEDFEKFLEALKTKGKTFIWRCGELEDVILSSENCNDKIAESLKIKEWTKHEINRKIKERLDEGERQAFYTELLKVNEVKRFISFMEEEENELFFT